MGRLNFSFLNRNQYLSPLHSSSQTREQKNKKGNKTVIPNTINMPDKTWIELEEESKFQNFMREYIDLLQNNLQKVEVRGYSQNSF